MMPGSGRLAVPKHTEKQTNLDSREEEKTDGYQFKTSLCDPAHNFLLALSFCLLRVHFV